MANVTLQDIPKDFIYETIAQETASSFNIDKIKFMQHVQYIRSLYSEYQTKITKEAQSFLNKMEQNLKDTGLADSLSLIYRDKKQNIEIIQFLDSFQRWSIKAYDAIILFRQFLTKQELIYHIANNNVLYTLDHTEYLKLLNKNFNYYYSKTDEVIEAASKNLMAYLTNLKLSVLVGKLGKEEIAFSEAVYLKEDALFNYIKTRRKVNKEMTFARQIELYDQLKYSYEWTTKFKSVVYPSKQQDKTGYFFTDTRRGQVDRFITKYIEAKMHKDNIAVHRTGDAVKDAVTLIEDKSSGGVISISTTINAIKNISIINYDDKQETAQSLKKIFTYYDGSKNFAKKIQKGAADYAVENIDKLIGSIYK